MNTLRGATGQAQSHYPFIDILRAAAAILVVVYHVIEVGQWREFPIEGIALWFRIGWIGVDLFFVISGFVITLSALAAYERQGKSFMRGYMSRRWLRIAPLYFCTLLAYVWLVRPELLLADAREALTHLLSHVLFLHNLHPVTHGSINGPNWSVALEVQFYFLIAFIAPWLSRTSALKVLLLFIPVAWAYRYGGTIMLTPGAATPHVQHVFSSQLPGTLDAFGLGIALALMVRTGGQTAFSRLFQPSWRNFILWAVVGAILLRTAMLSYWPRANYWDNVAMIVLWRTLLAAAFAAILAAAVTFPFRRVNLLWPAVYLGRISYGLYLWHTLVLTTLLALPWLRGAPLLQWTLCGTVVLAAASWHFLERPFLERPRLQGRSMPIGAG